MQKSLAHKSNLSEDILVKKKHKKELGSIYLKEKTSILQQVSKLKQADIYLCFDTLMYLQKALHYFDLNKDISETKFVKKNAVFQQPKLSYQGSHANPSPHHSNLQSQKSNQGQKSKLYFENDHPTFNDMDKMIGCFLLFSDFDEIHYMFLDFLSLFDDNQNFIFEREEFYYLIDFMVENEYMDKKILEKLIKSVVPIKGLNLKPQQLKQESKLVSNIYKEQLFQAFSRLEPKPAIKGKLQADEVIDFLKFFPIMFCFFLEFTKKRMKVRQLKYLQIIGLEYNPFKKYEEGKIPQIKRENYIEIQNQYTLIYGFNQIGYDYFNERDRNKKDLTFKQIEILLIQFKNSYQDLYSPEAIQNILQDLMKYLHVNPLTNIEGKKKSFGKIMEWLALKLGLHSCLSNLKKKLKKKDIFRFKEEIILWNCIQYSKIFGPELNFGQTQSNKKGLYQYIAKLKLDTQQFNQNQWKSMLSQYLKKKFSLILDPSVERISKNFYYGKGIKTQNAAQMCPQLYNFILQEIEFKLKHYLNKTFIAFGKDPDPKFTRHSRQNTDEEQHSKTKSNQNMLSSANSNRSKNEEHQTKTPALSKFLQLHKKQSKQNQNNDIIEDDEEYENLESSPSGYMENFKFQGAQNNNPKTPREEEIMNTQSSQYSDRSNKLQQKRNTIMNQKVEYKFLNLLDQQPQSLLQKQQPKSKRTSAISNQNKQMAEVNFDIIRNQGASNNTDIVQSCFIMENFLEKFLYLRKHEIDVKHYDNKKSTGRISTQQFNGQYENGQFTTSTENQNLVTVPEKIEEDLMALSGNSQKLIQLAQMKKARYKTTTNTDTTQENFQTQQRGKTDETDIYIQIMNEESADFIESDQFQSSKQISKKALKTQNQLMEHKNKFYFCANYMHQDLYDKTVDEFEMDAQIEIISVIKKKDQVKKPQQEQMLKCAILYPRILLDYNVIYEFGFLVKRLYSENSIIGFGFTQPQNIVKNCYIFNEKEDHSQFYGIFNDGSLLLKQNKQHKNEQIQRLNKYKQQQVFKFKQDDVIVCQIDYAIKKINFIKISFNQDQQPNQFNQQQQFERKTSRQTTQIKNTQDYRKSQYCNVNQDNEFQGQNTDQDIQFISIEFDNYDQQNLHLCALLSKPGDEVFYLGEKMIQKTIENVSLQERFTKPDYLKNQIQINPDLLEIKEEQFYEIHSKNKQSFKKKPDRDCTCQIY